MGSFKSKILITFIVAVSLLSSAAFYVYSNYLSKRIYQKCEENTHNFFDLVNRADNLSETKHNKDSFAILVRQISETDNVLNTYFIGDNGEIKFIKDTKKSISKQDIENIINVEKKISIYEQNSDNKTFTKGIIRLSNQERCKECHSKNQENIGYIAFDYELNQHNENLDFTRRFSIFFTIFFILILGTIVAILHYRIVKVSLNKFNSTINIINEGNYDIRVEVPKSRELGHLAVSFNDMLSKFQKATQLVEEYHKKELDNKIKLATIGEMAASLAHEIRNPITGIANAIEIIVEETKDEDNKPILEEIKRQAKRVNEVVTNLLKYSKNQELSYTKANINDIINSTILFFSKQNLKKNITFETEQGSEIQNSYFDNVQIENAIQNITLNAIQAIEKQGNIKFKTYIDKENNCLIIQISDNGVGISEKHLNDIFKPFFTTKTEGTGLGLSICKDIIDKHLGEITYSSTLNKGTTVSIKIPYKETF